MTKLERAKYMRTWHKVNRKKVLKQKKEYYKANLDKELARGKAWRKANQEKYLAYLKEYREANRKKEKARNRAWQQDNPDKVNSISAKRRAKKLQATPPWTTDEDYERIKGVYLAARELARLAGCRLEVDHIVPLQGKEVCGLHVFWNLQLLETKENIKKGNR